MSGQTDLRRSARRRIKARALVFFEASGGAVQMCWGHSRDISDHGMGLDLSRSIPRGSYVYIRLENPDYSTFGIVRHSSAQGTVGVELRGEEVRNLDRNA